MTWVGKCFAVLLAPGAVATKGVMRKHESHAIQFKRENGIEVIGGSKWSNEFVPRNSQARVIYLVRHCQTDNDGQLTCCGTRQAYQAGVRLTEEGVNFDEVWCSTSPSATDTLRFMSNSMTEGDDIDDASEPTIGQMGRESPQLRETNNVKADPKFGTCECSVASSEAAFRRFMIRKVGGTQKIHRELYVTHLNLIRYFTLRLLQLPPALWSRVICYHGSVTKLTIEPKGYVKLDYMGSNHLIAPEDRTFTNPY